jgi:hypothetical protein
VASLSTIKAGVAPVAPAKQAIVAPVSPGKVSGSPMLTGSVGVAPAPKPLTATVKGPEGFDAADPNTTSTCRALAASCQTESEHLSVSMCIFCHF